jgi:hypothetical protein
LIKAQPLLGGKAVNMLLCVKGGEKFCVTKTFCRAYIREKKIDDDPFAGGSFPVDGFVEQIGRQQHKVPEGKMIQISLEKMLTLRGKEHHDLIVGMEVLEFHVGGGVPLIIIEIVQQFIFYVVDNDKMFFFKQKRIINNHNVLLLPVYYAHYIIFI